MPSVVNYVVNIPQTNQKSENIEPKSIFFVIVVHFDISNSNQKKDEPKTNHKFSV